MRSSPRNTLHEHLTTAFWGSFDSLLPVSVCDCTAGRKGLRGVSWKKEKWVYHDFVSKYFRKPHHKQI